MIDPATKKWIDEASYEELLSSWRFAPIGNSLFTGETGEYYAKVMMEKKEQLSHNQQVQASKNIGLE